MRLPNFRSDLVATTFSVGATSLIKLVSALVLTRLLYPEAYGIVAVVVAVVTVMELMSDIGVLGFVIRDKNAEEPRYVSTLWTLRLLRGCANFVILFACAPLIAALYGAPLLTEAIRTCSLLFVVMGLESMSFPMAIRHQRARIVSYSELVAASLSTCFVIGFSYYSRDHMGMIYGILLNRLLLAGISHLFYRHLPLRPMLDREVARDLWGFSKFVMPSSMVSLALNQFDKIVFLRLFDLRLMGLYGVAANIAGPVDSLISTVTRRVLYARCAHSFRNGAEALRRAYYANNTKLFAVVTFLPAAVGGAADFIVTFLFDHRYAYAGTILQAFMVQSVLLSLAALAEQPLMAAGRVHTVLVANLLRIVWMVPGSLLGYALLGFEGFLYGYALNALPAATYNLWMQHRAGLLIGRHELLKIAFAVATFVAFFALSRTLTSLGVSARMLMPGT